MAAPTINGTPGDDEITGTIDSDIINGGGGDDTLVGGGGDDTLIGGSGNDTLQGGNKDTLIGGTGDDVYIFEDPQISILDSPDFLVIENADEGHDTIYADANFWMGTPNVEDLILVGTGNWIGYGNNLDNLIRGNSGLNYLTGDGGDDHILGFGGEDIIFGNDGNDTLEGGDAFDSLFGEDGDDILIDTNYGNLSGGGGDDTLIGSGDPDNPTGASYSGAFSDYEIRRLDADHVQVRDLRPGSPDGTDILTGITELWFSSGVVALGVTPVVSAVSPIDAMHGQELDAGDIFPFSDPDTEFGIKVQIRDLTDDPQSGHFTVNGYAQPANTIIELWEMQFDANTSFVTGFTGDIIEMRVFDGATWSAADGEPWAQVTINILANNAPIVITPPPRVAAINQVLPLSSLFHAYDLEGDAITTYQIRDKNADPSSGYVRIAGVVQPADTVIEITKAQLSQTQFVVGRTSDDLEIRAFDGIDWSAPANSGWASVTVLPTTGTAGNDTISGTDGPDVINGLDGDDYLLGMGGDDTLNGGAGQDELNGGGGNDTLNGDAGDDRLIAGSGNDVLNGGSGIDMATFSNPFGSYAVSLADGTAITAGSSHTLIDIENVSVFGSGSITVIGNGNNNEIAVFNGSTVSVSAGNGDDTVVDYYNASSTLDGGGGSDTLYLSRLAGTSLNITFTPGGFGSLQDGTTYTNFEALGLATGSGNDAVTFNQPNTLLENAWEAGDGIDTVTVDISSTTLAVKMAAPQSTSTGTSTTVEVYSRRGISLFNVENYRIFAGSAADSIAGGNGNDEFAGGAGNDTLNGGGGTDVARYSGLAANYRITRDSETTAQIVDLRAGSPDGTDSLASIERLQWSDGSFTDLVGLPITTPNAIPGTNGKSEIFWQNDNGQVLLWRMNGAAVQASGALPQVTADWKVKEKADFNGDSKADILWQNDDGRAAVWMMDGNTMLANGSGSLAVSAGSWRIRTAGDFNSDGKADIAWQNGAGQSVIWLMNGTSLIGNSGALAASEGGWQVKASGDFNGDGKADLLWQSASGQAAIWLMNGTTMLPGSGGLSAISPDWKVKEAGDFNGDGKADILWQNDNGQAAIWLMNGTAMQAGSGSLSPTGPEWQVRSTGDYNSDGKSDIAWQNTNGQGALWLMSGTSLLPGSGVMPTTGTEWHLAT